MPENKQKTKVYKDKKEFQQANQSYLDSLVNYSNDLKKQKFKKNLDYSNLSKIEAFNLIKDFANKNPGNKDIKPLIIKDEYLGKTKDGAEFINFQKAPKPTTKPIYQPDEQVKITKVMPQDKKKPIIVNDKNDPRLKAYNDSLTSHNTTRQFENKYPIVSNEESDRITGLTTTPNHFGLIPMGWYKKPDASFSPAYKKPVQPVILEDKPKLEAIPRLDKITWKMPDGILADKIQQVPEIPTTKGVTQNYTAAKQLEKMKKPTGYVNSGDKSGIQEFQNGGQLGSTIGSIGGMALGSIIAPGIGTTIGGMLGSKAGNFLQNQFMNGGQSPLNQSNMNNKLTHYKGDPNVTDGINIGNNIKVDHNETNHKGYIYSDTLQLGNMSFAEHSKKIESKYSKRPDDKISKESKERELGNLAKVQESTGMTNQGNQMWSGGWMKNISSLANQANDFSNYTPNATTGPLETPNQQATGFYTSDDINSNKEAVGNIANTLVTQPTDKAVIQGTIEDERTRVGLQTTSPTLNKPAVPTGTPTTRPDGTKPLQTEVNPLGFIASNIGPAFDILQGLKGGDDVMFDRIKQTYANPNPAITAMDNTTSTSFNNARNAIRNNATSSGEYLAMMNNLSGSESLKRGLGKASIKSEYDKINSGTANQISAQNAGIQMQEADARQRETDAARSAVSQGSHNFGQNSLGFGQDIAMNKSQNTMLPMLSDGYEYFVDADGKVGTRRKKGLGNSKDVIQPFV